MARGDLAEEILQRKEPQGGFILTHSSAPLAQSLAASGLIDEYRRGIHPVVLSQGPPLFSGLRIPLDMRLVSAPAFRCGAVGVVYSRLELSRSDDEK